MSKKRVYYRVNRQAIHDAIRWYTLREECDNSDVQDVLWEKFYKTCESICPESYTYIAMPALVQAMWFSGSLTEENLYMAIIAAGINTEITEVEDD